MRKNSIKYSFFALLLALFVNSCNEYDAGVENSSPVQNFGFGRVNMSEKISASSPYVDIPFFRTIESDQDQIINFNVNTAATDNSFVPTDLTLPTSVTIPAGSKVAYARVNFVHSDLAFSDKTINLILSNPSETLNVSATKLKLNYKALCTSNEVIFSITQDRYGSETTWDVTNSNGDIVWSGGPYTDLTSNTTKLLPANTNCLPNDVYTLTVYDQYGDGMVTSASVFGKYELKKADGTVLVSGLGNEFTTSASHTFNLP